MSFIVGRDKGPNKIVLPKPEVSSSHLLAAMNDDNTISIEDLGSSNGTFLNGKKIKRANFTPNDSLSLADVPVRYTWLAEELSRLKKMQRDDFTTEFDELKQVYVSYKEDVAKLRKSASIKSALYRAPIPIVICGLGIGFLDPMSDIGRLLPYFVAPITAAIMTFAPISEKSEKALEERREEFLIRYRCPKCSLALGEQSWNILAQQKQCGRCQAIWIVN